jgi:hypothetical protein
MKTSVRNRTKTVTIGIDLGELSTSSACSRVAERFERGSMPNCRRELEGFARRYPGATLGEPVFGKPENEGAGGQLSEDEIYLRE